MYFEPIKFLENLKYMGFGMLGVFMIVGIIVLATYIISSATKGSDDKNNKE